MKACRTCGRVHRATVKHRSAVKPITKADKRLSVVHLKDSIAYNKKHIADHRKLEHEGGSEKYNEAHIKGHEKALKKDKKLLEKRKEDMKEVPAPKERASKKLLRAMKGYRR